MMFNLLIAILSDTFATVMSEIKESDYIEMNNLVIEADSILFLNRDRSFKDGRSKSNLNYLYWVEYK